MKIRGFVLMAALCVLGLAPSAALAAGLSGSDGTTVHPTADSINAAMAEASTPGAMDSEHQAKGKKDLPALLAAAKSPCTMTDGYFIGSAVGPDKINISYYEVSCKEGMGFIVTAKDKAPAPDFDDCVKFYYKLPNGKPNPLTCRLAGNRNTAATLQSYVTSSGHICTVSKSRFIGSGEATDFYEVACTQGGGYIMEKARHDASKTPSTTNCVIYAAANGNIKCVLTTEAEQNSYIDHLVAASGKPCTITGRRVVGSYTDGTDFYEVSCSDKTGFMIKAAKNGSFAEATDCVKAAVIGDGCKLTDTRQAQTQQNNLYSSLSKKAGFNCDVSKYADFPVKDENTEIVELACSNRADGGVGFFPVGGGVQPRVLNCLISEDEGYKCSFTQTSALYTVLTDQLRAKHKTSCVVSDAYSTGAGTSNGGKDKDDYIEVACADGGPGYVLDYVNGHAEPDQLLNCAQAASLGGCKLSKIK